MTLGMKISHCRKELGLSQEALGEKLGVSRQAISKWEADAAIPEIDKLIALSKLFSVPVGQLLGVEEPTPTEPADSGELSERQEQMIEEIVSRYVAAMPKPKKMSGGKKFLLAAVIILVLSIYGTSINERISNMQSNLSNQISNIQGSTSSQINSISTRLQEIMEQGSSILLDSGAHITDYDPERDVYTLYVSASPKEVWEDSVCTFEAYNLEDPSGKSVVLEADSERVGVYTGLLEWPASYGNSLDLVVRFEENGLSRMETVGVFQDLYSFGRPSCTFHTGYGTVSQSEDLNLNLNWDYMDFFLSDELDFDFDDYALTDPYLEIFLNGELLGTYEPDMAGYSGEFLSISPKLEFPLTEQVKEGDKIGVFLRLTDQYGRDCRVFVSWCEMTGGGFTQLLDSWELQEEHGVYYSGLTLLDDEMVEQYADGNKDMLHVWSI